MIGWWIYNLEQRPQINYTMPLNDNLVATSFVHVVISPLLHILSPHIFPSPLFFCCHYFRPCSHQVQALILPPHYFHPRPQHPYRLLAEFQNWPHSNILHDCIISIQHILFHLFKPRFLHNCL